MESELWAIRDLFFRSLHNPPTLNNIINIALKNQSNNFNVKRITETIVEGVYQTKQEDKLYAFYILDTLIRSLGQNYINHFSPLIVALFMNTYMTINDVIKRKTLIFFRYKWAVYFSKCLLDQLDNEIYKVDPSSFKMRSQCEINTKSVKRKGSMNSQEFSRPKIQKTEYQHLTFNTFQGNEICPMPPTKMSLNPSIMFPPNAFPPININLPPPTMSNTIIPPQLPFPQKVCNTPNDLPKPIINNVPTNLPNMYDLARTQKEIKLPVVKSKNMEYFPNLSQVLETISTIDLDLDNFVYSTFSKFNKEEVDKLYDGIPCTKCGLRFKDIHHNEFNEHMYQHGLNEENSLVKRKYNMHYTNWVKASKIIHAVPENLNQTIQCPVFNDESKNTCGVCCEKFTVKFDQDEEEFMLQDAKLVNGSVYHSICVSDINKNNSQNHSDEAHYLGDPSLMEV